MCALYCTMNAITLTGTAEIDESVPLVRSVCPLLHSASPANECALTLVLKLVQLTVTQCNV